MLVFSRKRLVAPIYYLPLAFAGGIVLARFFHCPFWFVACLVCACLAGMCFMVENTWFPVFAFLVFMLLGLMNARPLVSSQEVHLFAPGSRILKGMVATMPELHVQGRRKTLSFVFETDQSRLLAFIHYPGKILDQGDRIELLGKIERPQSARNPHALDYAAWLEKKGIRQIFRSMGASSIITHQPGPRISLVRLRAELAERLREILPHPHSELANALILGLRKGIPRSIVDDFIKTGTAHILAISGLNIVLVGKLFHAQARAFGIGWHGNLFLTVIVIWCYTLLAGGDIPVLRAGIMGSLILMGLFFGHAQNLKSAFFASFFALLWADPGLLYQASFQLSFLAVASLLFILPALGHQGTNHFFYDLYLSSAAVTLGLFPVLIHYFHLFSISGFVVNALAVPLSTAGIITSFLALAADGIWHFLGKCLSLLPLVFFHAELIVTHWFARLPFGHIYLPAPGFWFFIIYYALLGGWLHWRKLWILLGLPILIAGWIMAGKSAFQLVFLDLGRAESTYVSTPSFKGLINAGTSGLTNHAYWVMKPFLMGEGVGRLDGVLLTSDQARHAGSLERLREYVQIHQVWTNAVRIMGSRDLVFKPILFDGNQVAAWQLDHQNRRILYVVSRSTASFTRLLQQDHAAFDVLYLPHAMNQLSRQETQFLKEKKIRVVIVNQRGKGVDHLRRHIERLTDAEVLIVEETGAIRLHFHPLTAIIRSDTMGGQGKDKALQVPLSP